MRLQSVILGLTTIVWCGVTSILCVSKCHTSLTADNQIQLTQEYNRLLSIETGYPLDLVDHRTGRLSQMLVDNTRRSRLNDLKCSYLSSALTHMSRTGILLVAHNNTGEVIEAINQYSGTAQMQLATLYELGVNDTDLLWRFYFYTNLVNLFPKCVSWVVRSNAFEELHWLMSIHGVILNEMKLAVIECRQGGEFSTTNFKKDPDMMLNVEALKSYVAINITNINKLLLRNNQAGSVTWGSVHSMSLTRLYLNDFGSHKNVDFMMIAYNVQVVWNNVRDSLYIAWTNAHYLNWLTSGMGALVTYHTKCIKFVILIMLRLTVKHLLYLNETVLLNLNPADPAVQSQTDEKDYVAEWQNILTEFVTIFDLTEDILFKFLVKSFDETTTNLYDKMQNNSVVNILKAVIGHLSTSLGCSAKEPMMLDGKEFFYTHNTRDAHENPIENYSIKCAQSFINVLKTSFENVDFRIINTYGNKWKPNNNYSKDIIDAIFTKMTAKVVQN